MTKQNFKVAWRNMTRNKIHSLLNIAGLAIGIASVILILFYVQDELNYDKFFKKASHIFQVNIDGDLEGNGSAGNNTQSAQVEIKARNENEFLTGNTPPTVGPALKSEFPEIEDAVRIYRPGDIMVRHEEGTQIDNYFTERRVLGVDSNFFNVFPFNLKEGNPLTCLQFPNSLVISEEMATKYFGSEDAMGKVLLFDSKKTPFKVTAVLKKIPSQSSLQFDMLTPISAYPVVKRFSWSWVWLQVNTYVRLRENAFVDKESIKKLEAKFPAMVMKYGAAGFKRVGKPIDEVIKNGGKWDLLLQPMSSVHLYSAGMRTDARLTTLGNIKYIYIFSIIALFIIILACVNFINLSTARSATRAKEVGIRKVLGSEKAQLIKQFLAEAMLFSILATIIAILLVVMLIKPFDHVAGKSLDLNLLFQGKIWIYILGLTILTGLVSGSYPAFYLTSFKPVAVLKGLKLFKSGGGRQFLRNGLVVFQFTISTALIICTFIVFRQLKFTQRKDLGFDKENVFVISNSTRLGNQEETFRQELTKLPGVVNASMSSSIPSRDNFADGYAPEPTDSTEHVNNDIGLSSFMVDYDYIPTLKIRLIKGRNFSRDFSDSTSVIINETAAKQIGWKEPIGRWMKYPGNNDQRFQVIGVISDMNIESLRNAVVPFALFHISSQTYDLPLNYITVRMKAGAVSSLIPQMESKWKSFTPGTPFDYSFLDSEVEGMYKGEQRMSAVFIIFTVLSIFVACLGLFGLSSYTAEKRTKEIGVRKVLGASVQRLTGLLTKDFLKLTVIASCIAFPVAWYYMHRWLQDFAYKINISWWVFAGSAGIALIIAVMTVSFQAIKAAIANPVKSLRTE